LLAMILWRVWQLGTGNITSPKKKPVDFSTGFYVARCLQATVCYPSGATYGSTGVRTPFTSVRTPSRGPDETASAVEPRIKRSYITELGGSVPMQAG
jgi:hypothetical protein